MNIESALPSPGVLAAVSAAVFLLGILIGYLLGRRRNQAPQPEILLQQLQQRIDGLARIFEMPRYRGQAGEWMLEQLLQDCLPPSAFRTQHSFRSGGRVDALIQLGNASVAVDAKFPLESLQGWQDAA
ncbi:MAG: DNA recombination protein RmuC, partial [Spirochaeta sp.]